MIHSVHIVDQKGCPVKTLKRALLYSLLYLLILPLSSYARGGGGGDNVRNATARNKNISRATSKQHKPSRKLIKKSAINKYYRASKRKQRLNLNNEE